MGKKVNDKSEPDKDKCWHFILIFDFYQDYVYSITNISTCWCLKFISTQILGNTINFDKINADENKIGTLQS